MTHLTTENAINSITTAGTLTYPLDHGQEDWCSYSEHQRILRILCESFLIFYIQYGMKYIFHFSAVLKGHCDVMV